MYFFYDTSPGRPVGHSILLCYKWNVLLKYTVPYFSSKHLPNVLRHIKNCSNYVPKGIPRKLLLKFLHQITWMLGDIFHPFMQIADSCRMWNHLFRRWIISRALMQLRLKSEYFACWIGPYCIKGQVNTTVFKLSYLHFLDTVTVGWYIIIVLRLKFVWIFVGTLKILVHKINFNEIDKLACAFL